MSYFTGKKKTLSSDNTEATSMDDFSIKSNENNQTLKDHNKKSKSWEDSPSIIGGDKQNVQVKKQTSLTSNDKKKSEVVFSRPKPKYTTEPMIRSCIICGAVENLLPGQICESCGVLSQAIYLQYEGNISREKTIEIIKVRKGL